MLFKAQEFRELDQRRSQLREQERKKDNDLKYFQEESLKVENIRNEIAMKTRQLQQIEQNNRSAGQLQEDEQRLISLREEQNSIEEKKMQCSEQEKACQKQILQLKDDLSKAKGGAKSDELYEKRLKVLKKERDELENQVHQCKEQRD